MSSLFILENNEVLDLFEIKISDYEGYFRFHGSKNFDKNIIFQGKEYLYIPCELSNLEYSTDGAANRPTLIISNINNFITNFIKDRNDLISKRFYRIKVLAKDLDVENFGGENKNLLGNPSFNSYISTDSYVIQKKNYENKKNVEFVLSNILDIEGLTTPARKVYNNSCQWNYRGCGCNYGKINGYQGPTIVVSKDVTETLFDINTRLSLTSNLRYFLQPSGQVYSGVTTVPQFSNKSKILQFDKLTGWTNQATGTSVIAPVINNLPKKYKNNANRMRGLNGVLFTQNINNSWDGIKLTESFVGKEMTVFYVSEMVGKVIDTNPGNFVCKNIGGYVARGLTSQSGDGGANYLLGYWAGFQDCFHDNGWYQLDKSNYACSEINIPRVYGNVLRKTSAEQFLFIKNGNIIKKGTGISTSPTTLGINLWSGEYSEIVIYEIIIYDKALTEEEVKNISFYLANKYNLPIEYDLTQTESYLGATFFEGSQVGNLGVPMADENDKMFLQATAANSLYTNYQNYGLKNLKYRGEYNRNASYALGDFVKIEPTIDYDFNEKFLNKTNEIPAKFFVCIDPNGSANDHPFYNSKKWREDKCSKTLNGCSLRFNGENVGLPFGGFPGTLPYEYKLPSS